MYCSHCGRQMEPAARFCPACGAAWQPAVAARRPLMRPRQQRFIAGVCAAFAIEYGWDLSLVRILAALALFCSAGTVALAYFAAWIVIPEEPYGLPERGSGSTA